MIINHFILVQIFISFQLIFTVYSIKTPPTYFATMTKIVLNLYSENRRRLQPILFKVYELNWSGELRESIVITATKKRWNLTNINNRNKVIFNVNTNNQAFHYLYILNMKILNKTVPHLHLTESRTRIHSTIYLIVREFTCKYYNCHVYDDNVTLYDSLKKLHTKMLTI